MVKSASLTEPVLVADAHGGGHCEDSYAFHEHMRPEPANDVRDYLIRKDGQTYAGTHLLVDFWGGTRLNDPDLMEEALREAARAARATLLHIHIHSFGNGDGVSGVAVLAESHISVHTWPEIDYAAFDVFMCGNSVPERAVEVLERYFLPARAEVSEQRRGLID